jgi:hypothetical protein
LARVPDIEVASEPDVDLGVALFLMLAQPSDWVHRRVEHVSFVDASNLHRRTSLDLSIPDNDLLFYGHVGIIPLALLTKRVLVEVDVTDESGASLPVLTRSQNAFVAWSLLAAVASYDLVATLGEDVSLSPAIINELRGLALASERTGSTLLESILSSSRSDVQREVLGSEDSLFAGIAGELAVNFLLLTELEPEPKQRRIVKFSYIQPLQSRPGRSWDRLMGRIGWRPIQFDFEIPAVGEARSYHFEFVPPEGLDTFAGEVLVTDGARETIDDAQIVGNRAHVYIPNESPEATGIVSLWLKPPRVGLLRALLMTSLVITTVLWLFFLKLFEIKGDAGSAILLGIPGVVATFIVRPGEHRLASDLLLGIRALGGAAGLSAYLAAVALVTVSGTALTVCWFILAAMATLCFASLVVSYWGLPPRYLGEDPEEGAERGQEN